MDLAANSFGIFALVAGVVDVLLYGILLFGVHKKKPVCILPALGFELVCIIISMIIYPTTITSLRKYQLILITTFVIDIEIRISIWIVPYSYYRQLADEKASAALHAVVNYTHTHKIRNEEATVQNSVDPTEVHLAENNMRQKNVV